MAKRKPIITDEVKQRLFEGMREAVTPQPGRDYETDVYDVIQVTPDWHPDPQIREELYNQGPTKSTRVSRHKFVPETPTDYASVIRGVADNPLGTVYVEFWKNGRQGKQWAYRNVPKKVYDKFSETQSKGKFINSTLNNYPYGPEAW